jgi:hypothetical protein
MPQYAIVYKALKFKGNWTIAPYGTHEHGIVYSPKDDQGIVEVHTEDGAGGLHVYNFTINKGKLVGVSLSENIVFIPDSNDVPLPP